MQLKVAKSSMDIINTISIKSAVNIKTAIYTKTAMDIKIILDTTSKVGHSIIQRE